MATEVGKLLVKIEADLNSLKQGLNDATKATRDAGGAMQKSGGRMRKALQGVQKAASKTAGSIFSVKGAIAGIITGVTVKGIFDVNAKFQDLETSLRSVLGGAEEAKAGMDFIREFALETPHEVETLTKGFTALANAGIAPTTKLMKTFSDASAVTTDKVRAFDAMVRITTRSTQGGLGLEELEQIADSGIPVYEILSEKLGIIRSDISEMGQSAEGARKIMNALTEGLEERYEGAGKAVSENLGTAFGNMVEQFQFFALKIGDAGLNEALLRLFSVMENVAVAGGNVADTIGRLAGGIVNTFANALEIAIKKMGFLAEKFIAFLRYIGEATGIDALKEFAADIADTDTITKRVVRSTENLVKIATRNVKQQKIQKRESDDLKDTLSDLNEEYKKLELTQAGFSDSLIDALSSAGILAEKSVSEILMGGKVIERFAELTSKIDNTKQNMEAELEAQKELDDSLKDLIDSGVSYAEGLDNTENKLTKLLAQQKAVNFAFGQGKISASNYEQAIQEINDQILQLDPIQQALTETIDSAVQSASDNFSDMLSGMKSFSEGFKDIFQEIVKTIIDQIMKLYVISPIINAIMGFIGGRVGGFTDMLPTPPSPRASGGTVQARRPIMVGERGAEIFVPNTGGRIMNNHQTNSAMRGREITVNQNLNFTTGIQNTVRAEVLNMLPDIVEASKSGVLDAVQRGGAFKRAFA